MKTFAPALVALALACGAPSTPEPATANQGTGASGSGPVAFTTLVQGSVPGGGGGQRREVVRDETAWQTAWADLQGGTAAADPPAVDFAKEMVIVAAMETQSCVAKVTIRGITRGPDGLTVDLLEAPPAPNCICIVAERPYHAVRLARSDEPVRFTVETTRTPC